MAGPTTYDMATGNKPSVREVLYNVSPDATPLYSLIGDVRANATEHKCPEDTLAARGSNKLVEGADYVLADPTPRTLNSNYCQIFYKSAKVTKTQMKVSHYGVKDEMKRQMFLRSKEIKGDVEYALVNSSASAVGDSATERELGGVKAFLSTNKTTPATLTEANFITLLQTAYNSGCLDLTVLANGTNKIIIDDFTGGNIKQQSGAGVKEIYGYVEVYHTSFGTMKFLPPHRDMANADVFCLDPSLWNKAWLRDLEVSPYPAIGSYVAKTLELEVTLECCSEKGNAWMCIT